MAVPTPHAWVASEVIDQADLQSLTDAINWFLSNRPRCYAYKSSDGSLGDNAWSAGITLNTEAYDVGGCHDAATNNSRVTAPEAGLYAVKAYIVFEANATGSRRMQIRRNAAGSQTGGTEVRGIKTVNAVTGGGNETTLEANFETQLTAGQYLELFAHQTSGTTLSILSGVAQTCLSIRWVGANA